MNPHAHVRSLPPKGGHASFEAARQRAAMPRLKTLVSVIAGVLAVMGCASPKQEQLAGPYLRPMQAVRHGADPQALYQTGRYFQGQGRYEQAIDAYRQVIAANPNHVDAHNALGVIHSLQNRSELAEQAFRAALDIASDAARVHNNLGYHLMVNGRVEEALASFERARALEPLDAMVAANIATARDKLGLPSDVQRSTPAEAQAAAQQAAPAPVAALASTPELVPEATMQLDRLSDAVWELRGTALAQPATATAVGTRTAVVAQDRIEVYPRSVAVAPSPAATGNKIAAASRIEIANGNGAAGLAKRVWSLLAPHGIERPRLTNDKPYGVVTSRIEYVAGAEQMAREVNAGLPSQLPLARVAGLDRNMSVRVLLGKDFPRHAAPAIAGAQVPVKFAAASPSSEPVIQ